MSRKLALWTIAVVTLNIALVGMLGQELVGSRIFGTVTDPTGAVVPEAEVKIALRATGYTRTLRTKGDGTYVAVQILADTYDLTVSKEGFKTAEVTGLMVRVNENARQDIHLELGTVATVLETTSQPALVNSYTSELSQTIDSRRVVDLPLNARDVTSLSMLLAGVNDPVGQTTFYSSASGFAGTAPSVNGGRNQDNAYFMDGTTNTYTITRSANLYPNPDAVQEFTMNTFLYSAEFGGRPGGQLSVRTKSGTNQLHGSLFEFVRNPIFNARNWADIKGVNDGIKRNQYGWAVGGPVYIPKIFDGRNHLFWFNSFQAIPFRTLGRPGFQQSFTALQKQGNFSQSLTSVNRQVASPACDGTSLTASTGVIFDPKTANAACGSLGSPFPGNLIPASRWDPVAVNVMKRTPDVAFLGQQLPFTIPQKTDAYQILQKVDFTLGKHSIMFRYLKGRTLGGAWNDPQNLLVYSDVNADFGTNAFAESFAVTETWIPAPSLVITAGLTYKKNPWSQVAHPNLISLQDLGSRIPIDRGCKQWAMFVSPIGTPRVNGGCIDRNNWDYNFNASAKWVNGKHEVGFGGIYETWTLTSVQRQDGGFMTFTGGFTGATAADFMLGLMQRYSITDLTHNPWTNRKVASLYVQDNVRINRRLTLNLGARWEPALAPTRIDSNSIAWLFPGRKSQRFINAPPGILYAGDQGTPEGNFFPRYGQIAPRFGFALDPTGSGKWAIRGGIAGFFGAVGALGAAGSQVPPLFGSTVATVNPPNMIYPFDGPPYNGVYPLPLPAPTSTSPVPLPLGPNGLLDPYTKAPNVWQRSLTIERSLKGNLLIRAGYVGARGLHLEDGYNYNLPVFVPGASSTANEQQRRPDQNFTALAIVNALGNSWYNALQLTVEKRYSQGISFLASYTWSKSIDTGSNDVVTPGTQGTQDPRGSWYNKGLSEFDRTHVLTVAPMWDLPKLSGTNRAVKGIFGHWQASSIVTLRSGYMLTPVTSGDRCICGSGVARADVTGVNWRVSGRDRSQYSTIGYFNQGAFTAAALGTFGAAGRDVIRGPGLANVDFVIGRVIPIRENVRLQFRSEYFNIFNRVNLGPPALDTQIPSTFGKIFTTATDPRILQFGLKLLF